MPQVVTHQDADSDNVIAVKTEAEFSEVLEGVKTDHLLVVDYYAPWCKPCQKLGQMI